MIITWKYLPKQVGIPGHLQTGFMENPGFVFRDKALQRDFFTEKNPQLMVKPGGLGRLVVWIPRDWQPWVYPDSNPKPLNAPKPTGFIISWNLLPPFKTMKHGDFLSTFYDLCFIQRRKLFFFFGGGGGEIFCILFIWTNCQQRRKCYYPPWN